jgi:hypothetical protein
MKPRRLGGEVDQPGNLDWHYFSVSALGQSWLELHTNSQWKDSSECVAVSANRVRRVAKAGRRAPPGPVAGNTNASTTSAALVLGGFVAGAALHLVLESLLTNALTRVCKLCRWGCLGWSCNASRP